MSQAPYSLTTLKSGVRLLLVPTLGVQTVTVMTLVRVGSHNERADEQGLSHFLEHLCFKGTKKRPTALAITRELDSLGAVYNAFTGNEYTGYYAKGRSTEVRELFDIIADLYHNPTFPVAEVEREKGVVIEEINMYNDDPPSLAEELMTDSLFGDTSYGRSILGTKASLESFTREKVAAYRKEHYRPGNTLLVVAGSLEAGVTDLAEEYFGDTKEEDQPLPVLPELSISQESVVTVKTKSLEQAHLSLGLPSPSLADPRQPTLALLSAVLGGGMSSRLFQKLREELGISYYQSASSSDYRTHGVFAVSAGVAATRLEEALEAIMELLRDIKETTVTEEELNRAREMTLGRLSIWLESSDAKARFYGMQALLEETIETPQTLTEKIKAVTAADIQALAQDLFQEKYYHLAVVAPVADEDKLKQVLRASK